MADNKVSISIIGAGASGIISTHQLVEKLTKSSFIPKKIKISLFDKSGVFGPGLAYSTPLESHLINMRAGTMSAILGKPDDFVEWLRSHETQIHEEYPGLSMEESEYLPRKVYGDYLSHLRDKAVERAKQNGIKIEFVHNEVVDIKDNGPSMHLLLKRREAVQSDYVILAPGNFPPTILLELKGIEGYFPYPWPVDNILEGVSSHQTVCVLGAGLSAIDTLFTLLENGHKEKIFFVSRSGFLPKVQGKPTEHSLRFITEALIEERPESLDLNQVAGLFIREIEAADGKKIDWLPILNPSKSTQEILEADILQAKKGLIPTQAALLATEDIVGRIWNGLSPEAKQRFDCNYKTLWAVYRHPMPLVNAEKILNALKSGQLEVLSGFKCAGYAGKEKGFYVEMQSRYGLDYRLRIPIIINATGQGLSITKYDDMLVQNLLAADVIVPHQSGGIQVDFETSGIVHKDGTRSHRIFALGEITRGVHFYTNAISQNARCADRITDRIVQSIQGSSC